MKITEKEKEKIKQMYEAGISQSLIAYKYGISSGTVNHIIHDVCSTHFPVEILEEWDRVRVVVLKGLKRRGGKKW